MNHSEAELKQLCAANKLSEALMDKEIADFEAKVVNMNGLHELANVVAVHICQLKYIRDQQKQNAQYACAELKSEHWMDKVGSGC